MLWIKTEFWSERMRELHNLVSVQRDNDNEYDKITYLNFVITRRKIEIKIKIVSRQTIITEPKFKDGNNTKARNVNGTMKIEGYTNKLI